MSRRRSAGKTNQYGTRADEPCPRCAGAAGTSAFVRFPAGAAEFTFKLGSDFPFRIRSSSVRCGCRAYFLQPNRRTGRDSGLCEQSARRRKRDDRAGASRRRPRWFSRTITRSRARPGRQPELDPVRLHRLEGRLRRVRRRLRQVSAYGDRQANIGLYQFEKLWGSGFRQMSSSLRPTHSSE